MAKDKYEKGKQGSYLKLEPNISNATTHGLEKQPDFEVKWPWDKE